MNFPPLLEYLKQARLAVEGAGNTKPSVSKSILDEMWRHKSCLGIEFYAQTLLLCHFIECDEEGKPMEKPQKRYYESVRKVGHSVPNENYKEEIKAYQAAKDRVLFEGWEMYERNDMVYLKEVGKVSVFCLIIEGKLIESVRKMNIDQLLHHPCNHTFSPSPSSIQLLNIKE